MKTELLIILFLTFGLMSACTEFDPHAMDMDQALHNPKTQADHEALAQHYENVAEAMQRKVDEHKEILSHFDREPWLAGRQAQDFKAHCERMIDIYENAAEENLEMAKLHRQM